MIVVVSARLPSNASTINGNPRASVNNPMVNLGFQAAFLAVSGFPEPIPSISLKVERGHVVQHQGGRPQPHMRCARGRYLLPPRRLGIHGEPTLHRRLAARPNPDLFEHPQGLQLAGRLDQPAQHQLLENLVTTTGGIEPEPFKPDRQGIPQVLRPRPPDR